MSFDVTALFADTASAMKAGSQDVQAQGPGSGLGDFEAASNSVLNAYTAAVDIYNKDIATAEVNVQKVPDAAKSIATNVMGDLSVEPYKSMALGLVAFALVLLLYKGMK